MSRRKQAKPRSVKGKRFFLYALDGEPVSSKEHDQWDFTPKIGGYCENLRFNMFAMNSAIILQGCIVCAHCLKCPREVINPVARSWIAHHYAQFIKHLHLLVVIFLGFAPFHWHCMNTRFLIFRGPERKSNSLFISRIVCLWVDLRLWDLLACPLLLDWTQIPGQC